MNNQNNQQTNMNNQNNQQQNINNQQTNISNQNNQQTNNMVVTPNQQPNYVKPNVTINTEKSKSSNFFIIFILIVLVFGVIFIDDLIKIFNRNSSTPTPNIGDNRIDNNTELDTIDGMIVINENKGYIKKEFIKFYNFKKEANNTIKLDYVSDKEYSKVSEKELYVEIYNKNKELLYKELFNVSSLIERDAILKYTINLDAYVYEEAKYGKIVQYTDIEKKQTSSLVCTYTINSNDIKVNYQNTFNFTNNVLMSYDVLREYVANTQNEEVSKYKDEIKKEYLNISEYNIKSDYTDNKLTYTIDLNNLNSFNPIYNKKATKSVITAKESLKKWICK